MMQDIEDKNVNLVITKDLSRLGRNYIMTGQYTEIYFPTKGVRYIAINDGYDSENSYTDMVPFKNVINEMYAKDISTKIRSAFSTKMAEGCFIGNFAPYGYQKEVENKNHLIVDEVAACIVQEIFALGAEGETPIQIARYLNSRNIVTPAMYRCQNHPYLEIDNYSKRKEWTSSTVSKILHNMVYLGHLAQGKTRKVSFKSNVTVQNQKEDWIVVKNTHEPIIEQDTFDMVHRRTLGRTCHKKGNFNNIFSGLTRCKDCGHSMSMVGTRKKGSVANLACGRYKLYGASECTNHFIDYNVLNDIVLEVIKEQLRISEPEKKELIAELKKEEKRDSKASLIQKEIDKQKKRICEIDSIIEKLFEDNFQGIINKGRYEKLLTKYEEESKALVNRMGVLLVSLEHGNQNELSTNQSCDQYPNLMKEYMELKVLSTDILYKLIEKIEISQGAYEQTPSGRIKHQTIQIYFRSIGNTSTRKFTYS